MSDHFSRTDEVRKGECLTHGDFESRNLFGSIWTRCPICQANEQEKKQAELEEKNAMEKRRAWERKLGMAGIPTRFHDRTLDCYKATLPGQQSALEFARAFAAQFETEGTAPCRNAIFTGSPGTGKTHLSIGIGLHAMEHDKLVLFTTVQRLARRVKDCYQKDAVESESSVISLFAQADYLILDEIGVQHGSEFEKNLLFDLLNSRYEANRPTVLISNLTMLEMKSYLGERVFDRLREHGGQCVPFHWESYRGQF